MILYKQKKKTFLSNALTIMQLLLVLGFNLCMCIFFSWDNKKSVTTENTRQVTSSLTALTELNCTVVPNPIHPSASTNISIKNSLQI